MSGQFRPIPWLKGYWWIGLTEIKFTIEGYKHSHWHIFAMPRKCFNKFFEKVVLFYWDHFLYCKIMYHIKINHGPCRHILSVGEQIQYAHMLKYWGNTVKYLISAKPLSSFKASLPGDIFVLDRWFYYGSRKNSSFLSGPALVSPTPRLSGHMNFFPYI